MKNHTCSSRSKNIADFARSLYERGFLLFAFLTMLLAMAVANVNTSGTAIALTSETKSTSTSRHAAPKNTQWLNRQAELLTRKLQQNNIRNAAVYHRVKSQQSAEQKARRKNKPVEALNDLYGMRVVVENEFDVYRCLGQICDTFEIVPGTLKNYIANPKPSGYQSIHIVAKIDNRHVEFQLRTREMHARSEAEHEAYKARMSA